MNVSKKDLFLRQFLTRVRVADSPHGASQALHSPQSPQVDCQDSK